MAASGDQELVVGCVMRADVNVPERAVLSSLAVTTREPSGLNDAAGIHCAPSARSQARGAGKRTAHRLHSDHASNANESRVSEPAFEQGQTGLGIRR